MEGLKHVIFVGCLLNVFKQALYLQAVRLTRKIVEYSKYIVIVHRYVS